MWLAIAAVVIIYGLFCGLLYAWQGRLLYFPTPPTDARTLAEQAEVFQLASGGEMVRIWQLGAGEDALLYFGGNAEDVAFNIPIFAKWLPNHTLYLGEYRGYGESTGTPTEAGLFQDALALYDHAHRRHAKISLIGRSLGSGVAGYVAAQRSTHKLVLITPYDSVLQVAQQKFPFFPVALLLTDRYDTVSRAPDITAAVLALTAAHDNVIPHRHTAALIAAFPAEQTTTTRIPNATHANINEMPGFGEALSGFLNEGE